jgi:hypothetical protein
MKQICAYCGQDTFDVDIEYLVGINHLSCALIAEQIAEKMQIINWKKIQGERFAVSGASLSFGRTHETSQAYFTELIDTTDNEVLFRVKLSKLPGQFDLKIEDNKDLLQTSIRRIVKVKEIKSLQNFVYLIMDSMQKNDVIKTYCSLLGLMQSDKSSKTKAKIVTGNTNFNMPVSQSIKW